MNIGFGSSFRVVCVFRGPPDCIESLTCAILESRKLTRTVVKPSDLITQFRFLGNLPFIWHLSWNEWISASNTSVKLPVGPKLATISPKHSENNLKHKVPPASDLRHVLGIRCRKPSVWHWHCVKNDSSGVPNQTQTEQDL